MSNTMLVAVGGFLGAMARFGMSKWISSRTKSAFPYGTFAVNLIGSFLLGLIIGSQMGENATLFFGTGFMGAFTTFSTFKVENIIFYRNKERKIMFWYLGLSYILGVFVAFVGFTLGSTS
ncbi:fluoride efflux transporter CrcB [Tepidibacillus fermentans]|uniref:Fluoride-specific ion channel FluC n=1 Tax=Tepidibacillus fermentans TaxID=1281767 RepID=A0A4R3KA02_9BACI|nr:fluoride efflux transporter CrcB [Tepidibacillus fermentans]TCS79906.1 camphor resistance protein CrcB [Tepidibacillus fermentans]